MRSDAGTPRSACSATPPGASSSRVAGFFIVRAAWEYDPKEAIGLDGALAKLANAEYGPLLLGVVAAGLFAYGLFCLVQARYRRV